MSIDTAAFTYVSELVRNQAAIVVAPGKEYLVESRLLPLARELGFGDAAALVARIRQRPDATVQRRIVEAMTTNETSFFRDRDPFRVLADVILPDICASRVNRPSRRISIWSAACSTGQEPYSIAISCLAEPAVTANWQLEIIATDVNQDVLNRAREGRYSQLEVNRGLPAASLVSHFEQHGREWRPIEAVRQLVTFRQLNLAEPFTALPRFDIVFLRNVLIYFDVATRADVLRRVRVTMAPDGYLVLGGAETILGHDGFTRVPIGGATVYRLTGSDPTGTTAGGGGGTGVRGVVAGSPRQTIRQRSIPRPAGR